MIEINKIHVGNCIDHMREMPDGLLDAIFADPPYGINYQSARRTDKTQWKDRLVGDNKPQIEWLPESYRVLKDKTPLLVFCEWRFQEIFREAIGDAGFDVKSQVIWDREWHGMGDLNGAFAPCHDVIWFAVKGRYTFPADRPKSVIRIPRIGAEALEHPTQKPVSLMAYLVNTITRDNDFIYDPFIGSGTTAIAAHKLNRRWIGSEISQEYVDLANRRLEPYLAQDSLF